MRWNEPRRRTASTKTSWAHGSERSSLRLALGTQLDVTEDTYSRFDPEDPHAAELAVYGWLSWLQEEVVHALATSLPGG